MLFYCIKLTADYFQISPQIYKPSHSHTFCIIPFLSAIYRSLSSYFPYQHIFLLGLPSVMPIDYTESAELDTLQSTPSQPLLAPSSLDDQSTKLDHHNNTSDDVKQPSSINNTYDGVSIKSTDVLNDVEFSQIPESSGEPQPELEVDDPKTILIKQLITASQMGDINKLKELIESGQVSANDHLSDNVSPLHWCAINNKLNALKYLISKGAVIDYIGGDLLSTPLHWACRYGLVYIVDYLIRECNADYHIKDSQGFNCLHLAIHSSNVMLIVYILQFTDIDIDSADPKGRTSLHWAAYQGDLLSVNLLVLKGSNVNLIDEIGFTPLYWGLVKANRSLIVKLLKEGSNINFRTLDNNKSVWDICNDMKSTAIFKNCLKSVGLNEKDGSPKKKEFLMLNEDHCKWLTFLSPYLTLGLIFYLISDGLIIIKILLSVLIFFLQISILVKFVIPVYNNEFSNSLIKSPFFAGLFSATAFWCIATWLVKILPNTFLESFFTNLIFLLSSTILIACFIKAMVLDPGYIPNNLNNNANANKTIIELIDSRKFDSKHFCISTFIKIPLRSKLNRSKLKNVARFDHYCPWINNDVGVRNHKLFFGFIVFLEISILSYIKLSYEYFDELDDDNNVSSCHFLNEELCNGYYQSSFIYNLAIWASFQLIWLSFLVFVQILQISKGMTTDELSTLHKEREETFSSIPTDEINDSTDDSDHQLLLSSGRKGWLCIPSVLLNSKLFKILGLNQFLILTDDVLTSNKGTATRTKKESYNFGIIQNWKDFLFLKRNNSDGFEVRQLLNLPLVGEGMLNGTLIDYYKLYEVPNEHNNSASIV